MKMLTRLLLATLLSFAIVGCGDESPPPSPPPSPPTDANASPVPDANATPPASPQTWFGPPPGADLVVTYGPHPERDLLLESLSSIPVPVVLRQNTSSFSPDASIVFYQQGDQAGLLGVPARSNLSSMTGGGFTLAAKDDRLVVHAGDSPETTLLVHDLLTGHAAKPAFADNLSDAPCHLFLPKLGLSLALNSSSDHSLALRLSSISTSPAPSPSSDIDQWKSVPANAAAFFGAIRSGTLVEPLADYLIPRVAPALTQDDNASKTWPHRLAKLLGTAQAPVASFQNQHGGTLFTLSPPPEVNATQLPYDLPEQMKRAPAAIHVDFPRLHALLQARFSPLVDQPAAALAFECIKSFSAYGDSGTFTLRLRWNNSPETGGSAFARLIDFLNTLDQHLFNERFYKAILTDDLAFLRQTLPLCTDLTPLNLAGGLTPLHIAAWQGRLPALALFLSQGMSPDLADDANRTPLHMAAWSGNPDAAQILLDANASSELRDASGVTPTMEAARIGNPATLDLLLSSGADLNATDAQGGGLVEHAASGGHKALATILRNRGAAVRFPMHVAAGVGDMETLRALTLEANATDLLDGSGSTPLLYAASGGQEETFDYLLAKGADPKVTDKEGLTLLHAAAISGNTALLDKTVKLGLPLNPRHAERGATPLDWAIARKDGPAADLLRDAGAETGTQLDLAP